MPTELVGATSKEVSGVDAAANLRKFIIQKAKTTDDEPDPKKKKPYEMAKTLIAKWFGQSAPDEAAVEIAKMYGSTPTDEGARTFDEVLEDEATQRLQWKIRDDLWPLNDALCGSVASILLDPEVADKRPAVAETLQQYLGALAEKIPLDAEAAMTIKAAGEPLARLAEPILKAGKAVASHRMEIMTKIKGLLDGLIDEAASANNPTKGDEPVTKESTMPNTGTAAATAPPETITKAELADIRKQLDDAKAEAAVEKAAAAEITKRLEAAETIAKAERDTRLEAEAITKAAKAMSHVPGTTAAELGPVLKRAKEALPEADFAVIEKALAGASEAIKKGDLFREIGTGGQGATDAMGQIEGIAKSLRTTDPTLSKEQAFAKAMQENPALYTQHVAERGVK